jgi:DNA polymerase
VIWLDTETFSKTPIQHGTYRYASNAEIIIVTYAFADEDPVQLWDVTAGSRCLAISNTRCTTPTISSPRTSRDFDRLVTSISLNAKRIGFTRVLPIERWRCTMAHALAHSLPGSLDKLCEILNVPYDSGS